MDASESLASRTTHGYQLSRAKALFFFLAGLGLIAVNIALLIQVKVLKEAQDTLLHQRDTSLELKSGRDFTLFNGLDSDNNKISLSEFQNHQRTFVLIFSPGCGYCMENMPNWQAIIANAKDNKYRVLGASLEKLGLPEYVAQYRLSKLPLISEVDPSARVSYNLLLTPQTILVDPDGKVERVWTGLLQPDQKAEIEKLLDIKLPDTQLPSQ